MPRFNDEMSPKEVLDAVPGLTRDKLNYWALKRYVNVKVDRKGNRNYNYFSRKELPIIKKAYHYIIENKMKDNEAFKKIKEG